MANLIGQVLMGQFRVEAFVASGGMGAVYRVWDIRRNVPLAMKVLQHDMVDDPTVFKYFQREARALKNLAHPNIVPFYGLFQTEEFTFLLEEYIDGPTLRDILRKKPNGMDIFEVMKYIKALCSALGYAHSRGVVHCDIKPGNVMISSGGQVYLADFGIARHAQSTTTTIASAGTPAYMAPEQIRGEEVTPATDVYELGILFYELLTGRRPFRGDEAESMKSGVTVGERIRYSHLKVIPQNPSALSSSIPIALSQVILKALAKRAQDRYQDMQSFYQAACDSMGYSPESVTSRVILPAQAENPTANSYGEVVIEPTRQRGYFDNEKTSLSEPPVPVSTRSNNLNSKYAMLAGGGFLFFVVIFFMFQVNNTNSGQTSPAVPFPTIAVTPPGRGATAQPYFTETARPAATRASTNTPVIIPSDTDTPWTDTPVVLLDTDTPSPFPQAVSGYNLAFISDRGSGESNMSVFIADPTNMDDYKKINTKSEYTHVLWPTFCGDSIAVEAHKGEGYQKIVFIDLNTEQWVDAGIAYPDLAGVPRCSPNGRYLAYSANRNAYDLVFEDINNLGFTTHEYNFGKTSGYVSWADDNMNFLYFVTTKPNEIRKSDARFSSDETLFPGSHPALSPDGRSVAYLQNSSLWVHSFDTNETIEIWTGVLYAQKLQPNISWLTGSTPFWAPDGWIYFSSLDGGDWDIFRIRPNGRSVENITQNWSNSNELMPTFRQ
jgi:serine/threonine protein kinase